jgi:hypothetical protein
MSKSVCVLAPWEVDDLLQHQILPVCSQHKHIRESEAEKLTASRKDEYNNACAEWIGKGKRRIRILTQLEWKLRKTSTGHIVYNLVRQ